jgi:hypothetical protein
MLNRREMITASAATMLAALVRGAPLPASVGAASSYFTLGRMLRTMRANASPVRTQLGQFSDVFSNRNGINARASDHYDYDARKVLGPQRSFASSVAHEEDFESIADWPVKVGAIVINPRDSDPMVGKVAKLSTGPTPGDVAVLRKYFGTIPASFGVSVLMGMATTATSGADSLELQVQNVRGHLLKMRVYTGAVQFFYNGAWNTQFAYGGSTATLTEWWFDAAHNGSGKYTIRLFAGAQELPGFTGNLPGGTQGENGWVSFIQNSSPAANRKSHLAFLQVGRSALPANMSLVSVAQEVVAEPTTISMAVMFEDVCAQTVINTDLRADVSKDGGRTWFPVLLRNCGKWGRGVLDANKPVYLLGGTVTLAASGTHEVCCRITSANGRYFSLQGYAWRVDA